MKVRIRAEYQSTYDESCGWYVVVEKISYMAT